MENTVTISLKEYEDLKLKGTEFTFYDKEFECPHCGFKNKYRALTINKITGTKIVYCDSDEGGCDNMVALKAEIEPIKLKELKAVKL